MSGFSHIEVHADLVQRAQCGDMQAHEALFRIFSGAAYTLLLRLVGNGDIARELLQDTFVEVISKIGGFRAQAPIGFWIRRIAVNKAMMHFRAGWNRLRTALPDYDSPAWPSTGPAMDLTDLDHALQQLAPAARSVVWLHEVEGYTHEEIGALMGKSASYSKSRLARALAQMRTSLNTADGQQPCMQISNS